MNYQEERTRFSIKGENKTNEVLNKIVPPLLEYFKGLEGKQILKSGCDVLNGELLKKHKDKTEIIINTFRSEFKYDALRVYLDINKYSIILKVSVFIKHYSDYGRCDNQKYLVNVEDLIYKNVYDFEELKPINEEEQLKIIKECEDLKIKLEEKKKELKPYSLREVLQ